MRPLHTRSFSILNGTRWIKKERSWKRIPQWKVCWRRGHTKRKGIVCYVLFPRILHWQILVISWQWEWRRKYVLETWFLCSFPSFYAYFLMYHMITTPQNSVRLKTIIRIYWVRTPTTPGFQRNNIRPKWLIWYKKEKKIAPTKKKNACFFCLVFVMVLRLV